jgi:hypothetical protein
MNRTWLSVIILLLLSMACQWQAALPAQPTPFSVNEAVGATHAAVATQSALTATKTSTVPRPTRTPTPSPVPIPSRTPVTPTEVLPTPPEGKVVLVEYFEKIGGETPWIPSDAYIGRHLPRLVIYTDGQAIWQDDAGALWEGRISKTALCTLLSGLQKIGLFKVEGDGSLGGDDPIYKDIPAEYLNDPSSTNFVMVVNGNPSKRVIIYRLFVDSLVQPVKSAWEILNSFKPSSLKPYEAELYVMWVEGEQKLARKYGAGEDLQPADWPKGLPQLRKLLGDQDSVQLPISEGEASQLLEFYDPAPGVKVFEQGENRYSVILRPLLPHEDLDNLSPVPDAAQKFALPFSCAK